MYNIILCIRNLLKLGQFPAEDIGLVSQLSHSPAADVCHLDAPCDGVKHSQLVPRVTVVSAVLGHRADKQPFRLSVPVEGHQARGQLGHQRRYGDRGARPVVRVRGLGIPTGGGEVPGHPRVRQTVPGLVRDQRQPDVPDNGLAVAACPVIDVRRQQRPQAAVTVVRRPPAAHRVEVIGTGLVLSQSVVRHGHHVVVRVSARRREAPETRGRQVDEFQSAQQHGAFHRRIDVASAAAAAAGDRFPHGSQPDPEHAVGAVIRPVVSTVVGAPHGQRQRTVLSIAHVHPVVVHGRQRVALAEPRVRRRQRVQQRFQLFVMVSVGGHQCGRVCEQRKPVEAVQSDGPSCANQRRVQVTDARAERTVQHPISGI